VSVISEGERETHSECAWRSIHGRWTTQAVATIRVSRSKLSRAFDSQSETSSNWSKNCGNSKLL